MLLIDEIYKKAQSLVDLIKDLPVNEQELVLFYALRLVMHNALMEEVENE